VNADGTGFQRLTHTPRMDDWEPVWSLNGKQIAFVSGNGNVDRLFVMNADGSGLKRLTAHQAESPAWGGSGH
jgi:Tol biopolymer transport system component